MKILFLARDFLPAPGGIAIFVHKLADQLGRRGHDVRVVAPRRPGWRKVGQGNYTVAWCPSWRRLSSLPFIFKTLRLACKSKVDIIFLGHFMTTHGLGALLAKRILGSPYVFLTHGNDLAYSVSTPIDQRAATTILDNASLGLCNSGFTQAKLLKTGYRGPTAILHPGVDARVFRPGLEIEALVDRYRLRGKKVMLSVARLVEIKNIDGVLRALPQVIEKMPNIFYLVVGSGPKRRELEELAASLGVSQNVGFPGPMGNHLLPNLYCASDLFVMVSHFETFGISYLEASACGRPVVASRIGGAAEAVLAGTTGLPADPSDTASIANAIITVLGDANLARWLGENGRRFVLQRLTWNKVGVRFEKYLTAAFHAGGGAPQ